MTAAGSDAIEAPNLFTLTGHHLSIALALTGIDGKPRFTYHDTQRAVTFTGDQITLEDTALGRQATVTLVRTVDAGNTTFTVLIPFVNLIAGSHAVTTLGITAMHRTSIAGVGRGQLTTYQPTVLHGTADQVEF
ncbi:MAG TPA: hypothetical protein VFC16_20475 [Nakamurella sp.]|nr:hypothetical protein [Nakamurella sp.]